MSVILVTGATSGIGRHAALHMARRGHTVFATGRRTDALEALEAEARQENLPLSGIALDVNDPHSIAAAHARVLAHTDGHGVDVLVNNAGYGQAGAVLDVNDQLVRKQFDTNVFGLLAVTRTFATEMMERGSGRIVNVSSIGGRLSMPLTGVYTASKFAVEGLSDAMRIELAPLGIRVVVVEPGPINTRFNATLTSTADQMPSDSPWGRVYDGSDELIASFESGAPGPMPVSRAIARAAESRWPRARYVAPGYLAPVVALAARLPALVVDTFFHLAFGFRQTRRPTALEVAA